MDAKATSAWIPPGDNEVQKLQESIKEEYRSNRAAASSNSPDTCFACQQLLLGGKKHARVALLASSPFSCLDESTKQDGKRVINYICKDCMHEACAKKFGDVGAAAGQGLGGEGGQGDSRSAKRFRTADSSSLQSPGRAGGGDEGQGDHGHGSQEGCGGDDGEDGGGHSSSGGPSLWPWWEHLIGFLKSKEHTKYRAHAVLQWEFRTFGYVVVEGTDLQGRLTQTDFRKPSAFADLMNVLSGSPGDLKKGSLDPNDPTCALKDRKWQLSECQNIADLINGKIDGKEGKVLPLRRKELGLQHDMGQQGRLELKGKKDEECPFKTPLIYANPILADVINSRLAWLNLRHSAYVLNLEALDRRLEDLNKLDPKRLDLEREQRNTRLDEGNIRTAIDMLHSNNQLGLESFSVLYRKPSNSERPHPQEVHTDR